METKIVAPLTTHDVSRYLNVDLTTVINWCEQGKLKAYKTPGGHRRVQPENFMEFLHTFNLPVPAQFEASMTHQITVLVVDDEEEVRKVVEKTLRKNLPAARIYEAQDGFEAGKAILDFMPDLVVLDLRLPGMDGFKVCANIRADERFKNTKILAITGQNTPENKERILKAGADGYLPKPFEVKDLMSKIFRLLDVTKEAVQ